MKYWLIHVWGMVEPSIIGGPYASEGERDDAILNLMAQDDNDLSQELGEDLLFWLDIEDDGTPTVGTYSNGFMDGLRDQLEKDLENE